MRKLLLFVLLLLLPSLVEAQTVPAGNRLNSTNSITITWPAAPVSADGLDAPDGYRIKANPVAGGAPLRVWDAGAAARNITLTPQMIPTTGAFTLTVHPFNVEGEAGASNALGPFGRFRTPQVLAGATAGVQ